MTVTLDTVLVQDSEPKRGSLGDDVVLMSLRAGSYFSFNGSGSEIWNLFSEPRQVGQVIEALSQRHNVDMEIMTLSVTSFLQSLVESRLMRVVDPRETR